MIVYLPCLLLLLGLALSYGSAGRRRQAGTMAMVLAVAWALALLVGPASALWGAGPLIATGFLGRPGERVRSTFEVLTRRAAVLAGLALIAIFLASQLPAGENPLVLNLVPWILGAAGAAWALNPIDARERLQGQVLMVGATAALVQVAIPSGALALTLAGVMAALPALGLRGWAPAPWRSMLSPVMLGLGALTALLALLGVTLAGASFGDVALTLSGPFLLGAAVLFVAAALGEPAGLEWGALLGVLALIAAAPTLRWSALAALVALATGVDRNGERPAWLAVAALAAVPVLQGLAPSSLSARFQSVALGTGMVCMLYAARRGLLRRAALPAAAFLVLESVTSLNAGNLTRLQWITVAGALLLIGHSVLRRRDQVRGAVLIRDALVMGLLLLALSARDALGLGALSVALLVIELAIVRRRALETRAQTIPDRLDQLAISNWPPAVTFAGATLAVIAALQASLALGLLASAMLAGLQLSPLLDLQRGGGPLSHAGRWRWLAPGISLACGLAPAIVDRMLRL